LKGIDHPDVDIVCIAGLPSDAATIYQEFGRAARAKGASGFGILFYDSWAKEINLASFSNLEDLDCPQQLPLTKRSGPQDRVGYASIALAHSENCMRALFARYLDDSSPECAQLSCTLHV
jgi:superfamily II DNA helicase RecQ